MVQCKEMDETHKIATAGHHTLEGIGTGTLNGSVTDHYDNELHVGLSSTIVPGIEHHPFSVSAAASTGRHHCLRCGQPAAGNRNGDKLTSTGRGHQLALLLLAKAGQRRHILNPADGDRSRLAPPYGTH